MDTKHKGFISYHHENDQWYKDELVKLNKKHNVFIDKSVYTDDIDENLSDETIRTKIRDEYLKDSTVTILLLGTETKNRKHIDWELYSSMYNGQVNKKSGILVVNLPSIYHSSSILAAHPIEKEKIHSHVTDWFSLDSREICENKYPYMPDRIIDNMTDKVKISVVNWRDIENKPEALKLLIDNAHSSKDNNEYDLDRKMKDRK